MKKILIAVLCLVVAVSCCAMLAACDHQHTYDESEWLSDDTHHWRSVTCEHSDALNKVAHSFDDNGKCTVCEYELPTPNPCEVDEETWVEAFNFANTSNWIYSLTVEEIDIVVMQRDGNVARMALADEEEYIEIAENGDIWEYLKIENDWQKVDRSDNPDYMELEAQWDMLLGVFGSLQHFYNEFEFVNDVYVIIGASFYFEDELLGDGVFVNATIEVSFEDGEIVSIVISEYATVDNQTYLVMQLSLYIGVSSLQLPEAQLHEHSWEVYEFDTTEHYLYCVCEDYMIEAHVYDENEVCEICGYEPHKHDWSLYDVSASYHFFRCDGCGTLDWFDHEYVDGVCDVCGVMDHEHSYNIFRPNPDYVDSDIGYCECGVAGVYDSCDFDENDVCTRCGTVRHTHDWKYTNLYTYEGHYVECQLCNQWDFQPHEFVSGVCSICDLVYHDHDWHYHYQNNSTQHSVICWICEDIKWEDHFYVDGVCTVCEYVFHVHKVPNYDSDTHWGYCTICQSFFNTTHVLDDDGHCLNCDYFVHAHDYQFNGKSDQYDHQVECTLCHDWHWEHHNLDDEGHCDVCGYDKLLD